MAGPIFTLAGAVITGITLGTGLAYLDDKFKSKKAPSKLKKISFDDRRKMSKFADDGLSIKAIAEHFKTDVHTAKLAIETIRESDESTALSVINSLIETGYNGSFRSGIDSIGIPTRFIIHCCISLNSSEDELKQISAHFNTDVETVKAVIGLQEPSMNDVIHAINSGEKR